MGCADVCLSADDYADMPSFHCERVVRAAKPHKCCECGAVIAVGERHEVVSGKWNGDFSTYRSCLPCVEIRHTFCCGGWTYGGLWEAVREELFPDWNRDLMGVECLARIKTPEAEQKMRAKYALWARDNDDQTEDVP